MSKIAILGATGPTGIHLAAFLQQRHKPVRVVARTIERLARLFPGAIEKRVADMLDPASTLRAIDGCDLVYDCIGLPGEQMHLHPVTARHIAAALNQTGAACVQVSSYWSYYPQARERMDESHPREGGPPWVRWRREAEDILREAGAAILHLPDFYGPQVHVSTLQNALMEAALGRAVNWLGKTDTARDYIYVADAMGIAATIGTRAEAFGQHWCLPGLPLTAKEFAALAGKHLQRRVKLRAAGMTMLRLASLFNKELRGLIPIAPNYMRPVTYDAGKLAKLIGPPDLTPYDTGFAATLQWLASA